MANVLTSWKEIAQYLGKGVRTVQRWEQDFGLPVRRANSTSRHAVLAVPKEIDEWVRCQAQGYDGISESPAQRLRRDMERIRKENAELRLQLDVLQFRPRSGPADGAVFTDGKFLAGSPLQSLRFNGPMDPEQAHLDVLRSQLAIGFMLCGVADNEASGDQRARAAATLRSVQRCIDEIRRQMDELPVRGLNEIGDRLEELNTRLQQREAQIESTTPRAPVLLASDAA